MEKIKISEDLCNYIERLHYETNALQDLISRMKNFEDNDINEYWLNKYFEVYKEYNLAKQELEKVYITPIYGDKCSWNLDFDSCEVSINK